MKSSFVLVTACASQKMWHHSSTDPVKDILNE